MAFPKVSSELDRSSKSADTPGNVTHTLKGEQ
jgi:hypothetical protein